MARTAGAMPTTRSMTEPDEDLPMNPMPDGYHPAAKHTMLLQVGSDWAVCTRTPVPVILARFERRSEAAAWQSAHEVRMAPARAA